MRGILSYQQLAPLLAERVGDLEARIVAEEFSSRQLDDELVRDFNGRVTRVFLRELLRRLGLPALSLAPAAPDLRERYLVALSESDRGAYRALIEIWKQRLEAASV